MSTEEKKKKKFMTTIVDKNGKVLGKINYEQIDSFKHSAIGEMLGYPAERTIVVDPDTFSFEGDMICNLKDKKKKKKSPKKKKSTNSDKD